MLTRIVERSVVFCAALAGCLLLWRLFWFDLLPDDFGMPDYEHELEGLAMVTSLAIPFTAVVITVRVCRFLGGRRHGRGG